MDDEFKEPRWLTPLEKIVSQQEQIRRLMGLPAQRAFMEIEDSHRLQQALRASQILDAFEMTTRLQLQSERLNRLDDLLGSVQASKLSRELDTFKQLQIQYEQSRLADNLSGLQQVRELQVEQEQLKRITSLAALNAIREIGEHYRRVASLVELPTIAALTEAAIRSMNSGYIDQYFFQSFTGLMLNNLLLQRYRGYEEFKGCLRSIESSFEEKIQTIPSGTIGSEGVLNILLAILLFIIGIGMDNSSEDRVMQALADRKQSLETSINSKQQEMINEFREFKNNVLRMIDNLSAEQGESKVFYVVVRPASLRSQPTVKSSKIGKVHPNQKVALIKSQQGWLYIEYFDYIEAIPKLGWVYKKNVKRLPEQGK